MARLGFTDRNANLEDFRILGDSINNVETTYSVNWSEDTWYHYEISHDGSGNYTGRLWEDGAGRPSTPQARSTGKAPNTDARIAAIDINGAHRASFNINHAYMKWSDGGNGGGPPGESFEVNILSFIPGDSENSTRGGDWWASAVSEFFPPGTEFNISINSEDLPDPIFHLTGGASARLIVEPTPFFDNWGTGDMINSEDYPLNLDNALEIESDKYEEDGGLDGPNYRLRNRVQVEFERDSGGGIDEDSVSVNFLGKSSNSVAEQEDVNTVIDDIDITGHSAPGQYEPRYYDVEPTTVDGVEAVRISTVFGGNTTIGELGLKTFKENPIEFLTESLGWNFRVETDPVDVPMDLLLQYASPVLEFAVDALAAVPAIFHFVEITVTADGEKYVRLWDHSPFPEHAVYIGDNLEHLADFPPEGDGIGRVANTNFLFFLARAGVLDNTPYSAPEILYLAHVTGILNLGAVELVENLIELHPLIDKSDLRDVDEVTNVLGEPAWQYGEDSNGNSLSDPEIASALPNSILDPFETEIDHEAVESITTNPF